MPARLPRKGIVLASFLLVACGPSSCHLFGPSAQEMAEQKAKERAQANRAAIAACEDKNAAAARLAADEISQQQTIIKTTLDKVSEGAADHVLDWSIEIAALDPKEWRWTESSRITSQHSGFLGSTSTQESLSTITYTLNPADLQESLTVIPHDDGTAGLRLYCKTSGCIHILGATQAEKSSNLPFAGSDSQAGTVSRSVNSTDWLLSTRTRAEGLKAAVEKMLQTQGWKAPACTNADGTPSEAAPLLAASASSAQ